MNKTFRLFLMIFTLSMMVIMPGVAAQDADVDVVADIVIPRLEAYNANLPDHYGTIKVDAFLEMLAENDDLIILDVRELAEVEESGIIEGSINVPLRTLGENLDLLPDLEAEIVVICKAGFRATIGMTALHVLGYENAKVLVGGFGAWVGEDLPVVEEAAEVEPDDIPEDIDPLLLEHVASYLAELPQGWNAVKAVGFFEETFEAEPDMLIDVRSEGEWEDPGYIEGATHIWIDEFMPNLDRVPEDLESNIVVYCASSYRGGIVATMLGLMEYESARNMAGGIKAWIAADLPVVMN